MFFRVGALTQLRMGTNPAAAAAFQKFSHCAGTAHLSCSFSGVNQTTSIWRIVTTFRTL
ncbi:hypothetical protein SAMN05421553_3234 [Pseudomonas anguilliseptica]|uniref:Uncharacterized protein n=1 Tax=Pseudomonas anguilliseptica TaxID=53406 RepID=A0A1H5D632_PSEAG|nr:hypothetical protein SAMN05421553_3234 [Pseudomonas anguilliseptica]